MANDCAERIKNIFDTFVGRPSSSYDALLNPTNIVRENYWAELAMGNGDTEGGGINATVQFTFQIYCHQIREASEPMPRCISRMLPRLG